MIEVEFNPNLDIAVLARAINDAGEEALTEATAVLLNRIRTRFLAQVDTDGKPWVPSYTGVHRMLTGDGGGTLFDTGKLFHSIQVYAINPLERSIGTDIEYAAKHQLGLEGMVKREFLGFNEEDARLAQAIVQDLIMKAFET